MEKDLAKKLINYFKSLGLEVYTNTKARGHQGFFLKNRIDISKHTKQERVVPTLLHEFAHYIHNKLEPNMVKTGGTMEILFASTQDLQKELILVTHLVDETSLCLRLKEHKEQIKRKIKSLEGVIKQDYPQFMRSKKFKEFDRYIKKSKAKYLLKYDRVKFISPNIFKLLRKVEVFSIDNIENDFPEMPRAFCAYIRLKSAQKKQARNSKRINYANKYYSKPTELFARLIEGLYLNPQKTCQIAPRTCELFFELLEKGYYFELKNVFEMLQIVPEVNF